MAKKKVVNDTGVNEEKNESFFEKMKNDKKYSAKVQLMGYGIFLVILVIFLNVANMGNNSGAIDNTVLGNVISGDKNTDRDSSSMLERVDDNYSYDVIVKVSKKSMNTETNEEVITTDSFGYSGKSYGNKLEINKRVGENSNLYYKVDNNYYSMIDSITSFVKDTQVYDVIDGEYIELDGILELFDKASLNHVTNYSSGKRESVYHLKVKDVIVSVQSDDVVEINVVEENEILKIMIDYSNLFRVMDDSIDSCSIEVNVTNIGKVEDFEVIVNNSTEEDTNNDSADEVDGLDEENTFVE